MNATLPVETAFPEPGKLFAERYEIETLVGRGGHSRVYRARQRGFDREVAVKVLNVERAIDRETRDTIEKRFYREARLLSRLRGPNTLRVYDYGRTESGQLFMVSELVDGTDLEAVLRAHGPLSERRTRRIFTQILQGLLEVHAEGFLHRDVKPSNVMVFDHLGERDRVKLLDFGIAKGFAQQAPDETGLTMAGFVIGTPGYMSPEQVFGEELLEASDLFSAGLVAYEMLVGRAPYLGMTLEQIQRSVRSGSLRLPGTLDVDAQFAQVVHRCLEGDPDARYTSAAEALRDLGIAPDTTEVRVREDALPANVLTFPMHVDFLGATRIDTLTDADTGQTTSIELPDTSPLRVAPDEVVVDGDEATANDAPSPGRRRAIIAIPLIVLAAIAIWALWAINTPDETAPSDPSPAADPAIDAASEMFGRSVRNAELDAMIAAKEAAIEVDEPEEDLDTEPMEFEEPEPTEDVAPPKPRPQPRPRVEPEPPAPPEPSPDFDVKMLDEL